MHKYTERSVVMGDYASVIRRWIPRYFRKEQLLVLFHEELIDNPFNVMRQIEDFLGLQHHDFHKDAYQLPDGSWTLIHHKSKNEMNLHKFPITDVGKKILDLYYADSNEDLERMIPGQLPW